jgi:hypothetical protein
MLAGGSVSGRLEEHIRKMAQKYRALILEVTIIDHGRPYGWEWQVSDRGDVIMTGFEDTREQAKYEGNSSLFRLLAAGW